MANKLAMNTYNNHGALVAALGQQLVRLLQTAIQKEGRASIAFSGGSTPKPLLQYLSQQNLDWAKVQITLVDERCVDQNHSRSNAKLIHQHLIDTLTTKPQFFPIYPILESNFELFKQPFDICILGMGGDGHTASFFPDVDNLDEMLNVNHEPKLMQTESQSSLEPRVTWNLPALLSAKYLALHITGEDKEQVLQQAYVDKDETVLPIAAVLNQAQSPLHIFYSAVNEYA